MIKLPTMALLPVSYTHLDVYKRQGLEVLLDGDVAQALSGGKSKYKLNLYTSLSLIDARYVNTRNTAIANKLVENVPPLLLLSLIHI